MDHHHHASPVSSADPTSHIVDTSQVDTTKLIASGVLFFITLLCGYVPVKVILNQNYIGHAMFAGGGVLMATAFCHLIPETHDDYKTAYPAGPPYGIPFLELTLCGGFFFMYLVELLMLRFINTHTHEHPCDTMASVGGDTITQVHKDTKQQFDNDTIYDNPATNGAATNVSLQQHNILISATAPNVVQSSHQQSTEQQRQQQSDQSPEHQMCQPNYVPVNKSGGNLFATIKTQPSTVVLMGNSSTSIGGQTDTPLVSSSISDMSCQSATNGGCGDDGHHNRVGHGAGGYNGKSTEMYKCLRGLLIVSAFAAHSIFDGVAIGSQTTVEKVWTIFVAICCHKLIIAAVVGLELFAATLESNTWTLVHLSIFSVMSPIGIILVVVAQNSLNLSPDAPAMILLQSFATGTLLYIIFVEILQPKNNNAHESRNKIAKSISMIAGFAIMVTVLYAFESH